MAMLLFGTVGTGKSSCAKSWSSRLVQFGKKLAVASDLKGEWTPVIQRLNGRVIQIGPGLPTRLNPLEEGVRPSIDRMGNPMTDEGWDMMVRTRRLSILETIVKILTGQAELTPAEHAALEDGVEGAADIAKEAGRMMIVPDVEAALKKAQETAPPLIADACEVLGLSLRRLSTGDVAGMFDGLSTVTFDGDLPAVSIDTAALRGATQTGRRVASACCGTWIEAMVTNPDGGQRLVVYEEGWDAVTSRADLQRMVENWKLARDYGIFNILILHKVSDLNMAGDQGSQMAAMAKSLLADADIKVIYRQDAAALRSTTEELELNDKERSMLKSLEKGTGLWRLGQKTFHVRNDLTEEEVPLFDTDQRLRASGEDKDGQPLITAGGQSFTDWAAPDAGKDVA
ncbi:Type IV secretory pathway, VirB4 components [Brevibacterium iodinum]|nr:conjugal transfer protein TraC [Brevibacterium iodinum]SUW70174.1 Type IV secretory pathway, VirB4 components [Brevibacterium iodinum]